MAIAKEDIQQVCAVADIVQVVGAHVQLKPAGNYYKGLCPFHQEKTPSFTVSLARNNYHCFGCGAHGNAINFVMQIQNYTFVEAVENLAQQFGVRLNRTQKPKPVLDLYSCLKRAQEYYEQCLKTSTQNSLVKQYLHTRNFTQTTLQDFAVGYAPEQKNNLQTALKADFSPKTMLNCGLVGQGKYGAFDFLRQRLVFPLRDAQGQTIGFAGRSLTTEQQPKYLNSPETLLYHKSKVFYGFYEASTAIRKQRSVILVEGYTDVLRMHEHGFVNSMATCGTAITKEHVKFLLQKNIDQLILLLDADLAGKKAALRSCQLCLEMGLNTFVAILPKDEDPDSFLSHNPPKKLQQHLDEAQESYDFLVQTAKQDSQHKSIEEQRSAFVELTEFCRRLKDNFRQQALQQKIEQAFGTTFDVQPTQFSPANGNPIESEIPAVQNLAQQEQQNPKEFNLIRSLLLCPTAIEFAKGLVDSQSFTDPRLKELFHGLTQLEPQDLKQHIDWEKLFVQHQHLVAYLQMTKKLYFDYDELQIIGALRELCKQQFELSKQKLETNPIKKINDIEQDPQVKNLQNLRQIWQKREQTLNDRWFQIQDANLTEKSYSAQTTRFEDSDFETTFEKFKSKVSTLKN